MLSRPARPINTLHLDDLVLLVPKCQSGFTHFVIRYEVQLCNSSEGQSAKVPAGNAFVLIAFCEALPTATLSVYVAGRSDGSIAPPPLSLSLVLPPSDGAGPRDGPIGALRRGWVGAGEGPVGAGEGPVGAGEGPVGAGEGPAGVVEGPARSAAAAAAATPRARTGGLSTGAIRSACSLTSLPGAAFGTTAATASCRDAGAGAGGAGAVDEGLTLVPISTQLQLTLPLSAELKLTLSPMKPNLTRG